MCGIIGCVGYDDAKNVLIKGLTEDMTVPELQY